MNSPSPKRTWRHTLMKYYIKVVAQKGTPEFIARGAAIGLFIGLLIPMTGQLIIAIPLAWLLKGSKLAATITTFITNPWTVVFIYPPQIYFGKMLLTLSIPKWAEVDKIYQELMEAMGHFSLTQPDTWTPILDLGLSEIILPFLAAGFVMGVIGAIIGYFMTLRLVRRYRALRNEHKQRKALKSEARRKLNRDPEVSDEKKD